MLFRWMVEIPAKKMTVLANPEEVQGSFKHKVVAKLIFSVPPHRVSTPFSFFLQLNRIPGGLSKWDQLGARLIETVSGWKKVKNYLTFWEILIGHQFLLSTNQHFMVSISQGQLWIWIIFHIYTSKFPKNRFKPEFAGKAFQRNHQQHHPSPPAPAPTGWYLCLTVHVLCLGLPYHHPRHSLFGFTTNIQHLLRLNHPTGFFGGIGKGKKGGWDFPKQLNDILHVFLKNPGLEKTNQEVVVNWIKSPL